MAAATNRRIDTMEAYTGIQDGGVVPRMMCPAKELEALSCGGMTIWKGNKSARKGEILITIPRMNCCPRTSARAMPITGPRLLKKAPSISVKARKYKANR